MDFLIVNSTSRDIYVKLTDQDSHMTRREIIAPTEHSFTMPGFSQRHISFFNRVCYLTVRLYELVGNYLKLKTSSIWTRRSVQSGSIVYFRSVDIPSFVRVINRYDED